MGNVIYNRLSPVAILFWPLKMHQECQADIRLIPTDECSKMSNPP